MRVFGSLVGLALLLVSTECLLPPSKEDLSQISLLGVKYLDKQIENAISGVKEMKTVMERSGDDHNKFLSALEKTKQQKEDALKAAQEMESKLSEEQEVCNGTMQSLWEECKPCLKNTCIKYYSRTCSSGAGLIGRQLEEVLNRTSPFSIWINGENMDVLEREDQEQSQRFQNLEERYSDVADGVDSIFMDSLRVFDHMRSLNPPMFSSPFHMPSIWGHSERANERAEMAETGEVRSRMVRSALQDPDFHGFHNMFAPMMDMARNIFGSMGPVMDADANFDINPSEEGSVKEDVIVTKPSGMTCREIRRNSAGCIKLRGECEKCVAIQDIDCSGKKPLAGPLKKDLEQALAMAEKFTQEYSKQLRKFEEQMSNTSSLLDLFSKQFGWVSALANNTNKDGIFKIETVMSKDTEDPEKPGDTNVSIQLFDNPAMTFSVPGDIPWNDPKFSEVVAQQALDLYKQTTVVVK
ncbi:clusterin-like isoform 1-T3 [Salvelinus alpinus]|uniref:clusterin n=1 Tax=Salvelinus sp. IW2-2015 TaxID=2691554 RepID=UPI000CDFF422|nr:clusterin [Salvelinus alpinus]